MPSLAVLDASAILALVFEEPGREKVADLLNQPTVLSAVNLAEVHTKLVERGTGPEQAWSAVIGLGIEMSPFTEGQARITGELIASTRPYGLSLGDRACLALAIERKAKVYTTDRNWKSLGLGIEVEVIR